MAGQIIPWNYPLLMAAWKLAPALCAGCTHGDQARRADAADPARAGAASSGSVGLPKGVVNVVTGFGETAGAPLVAHPQRRQDRVHRQRRGRQDRSCGRPPTPSRRSASSSGGKSPNIFFADADFEAAVDGALFGVFINQGEVCSAGSRVLVQRPIYKKMLDAMVEKAKTHQARLRPRPRHQDGAAGLEGAARARDRATRRSARRRPSWPSAAGARTDPALQKGYFVEPTIFYDVDNAATIAREEIFGPVMAVIPFDDEAEALRIANDTPYGLAAAVWSRDIFKCLRMVKRLQAGIVWVNHMQPTYVEAPWGGYKMSGIGRELGPWGAEEYLQVKQVHINLNEQPIGWY